MRLVKDAVTAVAIAVWLFGMLLIAAIVTKSNAQEMPEVSRREPVPCIAQYIPLTPYELLGFDTCNMHIWKLILPKQHRPHSSNPNEATLRTMGENDTAEAICVYWDMETGEYRQIDCPRPGQVVGVQEQEVRESQEKGK